MDLQQPAPPPHLLPAMDLQQPADAFPPGLEAAAASPPAPATSASSSTRRELGQDFTRNSSSFPLIGSAAVFAQDASPEDEDPPDSGDSPPTPSPEQESPPPESNSSPTPSPDISEPPPESNSSPTPSPDISEPPPESNSPPTPSPGSPQSPTPPAPESPDSPPQHAPDSPDSPLPPAPDLPPPPAPPTPDSPASPDSPTPQTPDWQYSPPPPTADSPYSPPPYFPVLTQPPMSTPPLSPETQPWTSPPAHLPLDFDPAPLRTPPGGNTGLIAGASAGSVTFFICVGILVWWFLRRRRQNRQKHMVARQHVPAAMSKDSKPLEDEFEMLAGPRRFGYSELAIATNFFSEQKKLGEGGFGSVYHGYLKDMNLHVAVKRVAKGSQQGKKEYISEVRTVSRLRHRNLVQLIGWCHDDNELLLVYQLMPNGSLDTHIHNQNKVLSWQLRHEIVLGIGSAILYLHEEWEQCVLHRDIKPSNLMLDASFNVKLGDFGLARLIDHGQESHTTMRIGTKGYMDPESIVTGRASTESDVYSFGVVVLEIVCGKRPLLVMQGNEAFTMELVQLIWKFYGDGRILDAADPRLNGEFDSEKMERLMVAALWCVHPHKSQRPSISQAVNVMRFEAPLPTLPAKMPGTPFVLPIDSLLSQSLSVTTSSSGTSYGTGTTHSSSYATGTTQAC